jgi:hypothetical protein
MMRKQLENNALKKILPAAPNQVLKTPIPVGVPEDRKICSGLDCVATIMQTHYLT